MQKYKVETRKEYEKSMKDLPFPSHKIVSYEEYLKTCRSLGDEVPNSPDYK